MRLALRFLFSVLIFAAAGGGPAHADALFDETLARCTQLRDANRKAEFERCEKELDALLEKTEANLRQTLTSQQAAKEINVAAADFARRFGIEEPDAKAKYEVARRKRALFVVILERCHFVERQAERPDLGRYRACLEQYEKAEQMLGNNLSKPAAEAAYGDRLPTP